jgi:hypothetical protein
MLYRKDCRLSAVADLKFRKDGAHMIAYGTLRKMQILCEISVRKPFRDYFLLPMT